MANVERIQRMLTQASISLLKKRLDNYEAFESAKKKDPTMIIASRTVAVNSCRDLADFLGGEIALVPQADINELLEREKEVPRLKDEIEALRKLVAKKKLKAHDVGKADPA